MKLATAQPAVASAPAEPAEPMADDTLDFGGEMETPSDEKPASDKPFDDTPFDAGVEADEETDPKKFIEQLTGKLGQSLRKYTEEQGQPDFELEKFAINSLISATHTSEMDDEDRKDIIKKINTAGSKKNEKTDSDSENNVDNEFSDDSEDEDGLQEGKFLLDKNQIPKNSLFAPKGSKEARLNEESNNYMFWQNLKGIHDDATEILGMDQQQVDALIADGHQWALEHVITSKDDVEEVYHFIEAEIEGNHADEMNEGENESNNYMFWSSLKTIQHASKELLEMDYDSVDRLLSDGHGWALDHIATSADDMEEVYHFLANTLDAYDGDGDSEWSNPMELKEGVEISRELAYHLENKIALGESVFRYGSTKFLSLIKEVKSLYENGLIKLNENDEFIVNDYDLGYLRIGDDKIKTNLIFEEVEKEVEYVNEAEYQGKKVQIGKPKRGGSKKFYVYVRNPKTGKVKKVSFGAKSGGGNLAVKLRDPKARKAFADRHNCEQKNDKTKPGYWACRLPRYAKLLGLSGGGRWW